MATEEEQMRAPALPKGEEQSGTAKLIKKYRVIILILAVACIVLLVALICTAVIRTGSRPIATKHKSKTQKAGVKFVHLSDIHLDTFYDQTLTKKTLCRKIDAQFNITPETATYTAEYGRVGCDSPLSLVISSVQKVAQLMKLDDSIKFVMVSGDLCGHSLEKYFTTGTGPERVLMLLKTMVSIFQNYLPGIPVFPAFGNNDMPGSYNLPTNSEFYSKVLEIWKPLLIQRCRSCTKSMVNEKELREKFLKGGYYSAPLEVKGNKIVVLSLNTNYWSIKSYKHPRRPPPGGFAPADEQLRWLENQLDAAKKKGNFALLLGHIPLGVDSYNGKSLCWKNFTEAYTKLVTGVYRDTVIGQFYGHFHKDEFKIQSQDELKTIQNGAKTNNVILIAPGITPIYENNPAIRVVEVDEQAGQLMDYEQYYMDLVMATEYNVTKWHLDYRFSTEYGLRPTADGMMIFSNRLIDANDEVKTWSKFIGHRRTNYQAKPYSRFHLYCAMRFITQVKYNECINKYKVLGG